MACSVDRRGHLGVPIPLRQLSQVTLLIRLVALGTGLLLLSGSRVTVPTMLGFLVIGLTSFFGLINTAILDLVRRHPIIAMADAMLLAAIVAINGIDSPLLLAALTTALLLGLWLEPVGGAIVMTSLVALYVAAALLGPSALDQRFTSWVTIPFIYVTLWLLGLTMRRSVESEAVAQTTLRDAVVTAAARQSEVNGWLADWPELAEDAPHAAAAAAGDVARAATDRVVVLTGNDTKGLEFDGIVVVSPQEIEDESATGRATLYVVLTRATQLLTTVG